MNLKLILFAVAVVLSATALRAQILPYGTEQKWPEQNPDSKFHTVSGYRHGPTFFPKVRYRHVQYEPTETLTFDKYHSADVVYHWLHKWSEQYPDLVDVYVVANSFEGRPIWQMTLTNKKTGEATDKPAAYFEGNRHSGEVSSTESVMWLIRHLIEGYGSNGEITAMLDKNAIYFRPINNPDGHNLYMHTAQSNRSTVRPMDNDGDGLLDEDGPEDLNGDGLVTQMRVRDSENGDYVIDPRDRTGRLMKRVPAGEGEYRVMAEGIDNDGDGRTNEDGIGGLDLHRNYAENWRPMREATGRGWTQGGAGEYPLSEIETRSVFTFLLANPNIYVINSMDTSVPMHLRAPSTSPTSAMFPEDAAWYLHFDEVGKGITGYERAGDAYQDYGRGTPIFGHGPDFGYWYYGSIWYGDEIWNNGRINEDVDGDGTVDDLDRLLWDDKYNDGVAFQEWTPLNHPTLGEVEVGGWDPKFFSQNSPSKQIERWAGNQALFNYAMLTHLPELQWEGIDVKVKESYGRDSTDYEVKVSYRNAGELPTALRQADLVKIVRPDRVTLSIDPVEGETRAYTVLPESGAAPRGNAVRGASQGGTVRETGYTEGGASNGHTFTVRVYGRRELNGKASVSTTRAGMLPEREFVIKP